MNPRTLSLATALAVSIVFARPARADVPPPNGYVETCTVADRQTATSECLVCLAERGRPDRCEPLLAPYCFTKVCATWSGSSEIWCRTSGAGVPTVPSATLDILRPTTYPYPSAIDGGIAADPSACLPYVPGGAGGQGGASATSGTGTAGASGPSSSDPGNSNDSSGCAMGGWVSTKTLGPWMIAGLFAALVTLRRRLRR